MTRALSQAPLYIICTMCVCVVGGDREAVGSYAENQRITAVRKVYQRGVVNPMLNIEALWKDYGAFENVGVLLGNAT